MPDFLEAALRHHAKKKGLTGKHADNYVYGTMNSIGAMHGSQITPKGEAMEAKHDADMKAAGGTRRLRVKRRRDLVELK
jgi:hypothetical protein